jgi:hypothetical protein
MSTRLDTVPLHSDGLATLNCNFFYNPLCAVLAGRVIDDDESAFSSGARAFRSIPPGSAGDHSNLIRKFGHNLLPFLLMRFY